METPGTYAGHTALCAAFEQGAGLAAEREAWRALALAYMSQWQQEVLTKLAQCATDAGWVSFDTLFTDAPDPCLIAGKRLISLGLIEGEVWDSTAHYRLTPFGAQVARALGEG